MCDRCQHKRRILTCPHNGGMRVQPSHPCKRQQPLYVNEQEDVTLFNSSVLTEACFRTNQVLNTFICYDLYILQLASFNCHAAKVPPTNHHRYSQSEIGSCKILVPEIPTNPGLESSGTTPNMDENPRRHCWECLRRRVVCDYTRPACNRCTKSGIQCPGYGDVKPARLRWLPPGKVISRQQKRKGTADLETERYPVLIASGNVDERISPILATDTETRALLEAVEYCNSPRTIPRYFNRSLLTLADNTCIYQDLLPIHELGQHPGIYLVTPTHLQIGAKFPAYIRFTLICTTLSHRINRLGNDTQQNALAQSFYHFRGIIIRSLREDINVRHNSNGDMLVAGIIALLLADVSLHR